MLSLDGSLAVELDTEAHAGTAPSILDYYLARSFNSVFSNMTLLTFARSYTMPKELSGEPTKRRKDVVIIMHPYISPDCNGPNYEQYCHQKLMLYVSFRQLSDLLRGHDACSIIP